VVHIPINSECHFGSVFSYNINEQQFFRWKYDGGKHNRRRSSRDAALNEVLNDHS
jgi:hypothetical protein